MAAVEVMLATRQLHGPLLLAAGLLLVFYALMGRVFCGWICPLGLLLDLNDDVRWWLRRRLGRWGWRLPEVRLPLGAKYWLLALGLGLSLVARLPVFQLVSPINILARALIFAPGPGLLLVGGIVALEYVSRRAWCRALCPLGAFYSLAGHFGRVLVFVNQQREQARKACRLCTLRCPMGIRVLEDHIQRGKLAVDDRECTRCGSCMDPCPRGSLRLGLKLPGCASGRRLCLNGPSNPLF